MYKLWAYFADKFNNRGSKKKDDILVCNPFKKVKEQSSILMAKKTLPKLAFSLSSSETKSNQNIQFKLVAEQVPKIKQKLSTSEQDLLQNHQIIQDVRQLNQQLRRLTLQERKTQQAQNKVQINDTDKSVGINSQRGTQRHTIQLKRIYDYDIVQFRECKYSKQLQNYPLISFNEFKAIHFYWREKKRGPVQIKRTRLQSVDRLTYKTMGTIDHGQWLNDQVINIYIELMEKKNISQLRYKLVNSFFATNTLTKSDNMILRFVKKKGIDKNDVLVIPVNDSNHWYFVKLDEGLITIYDSLPKRCEIYQEKTIFKNLLKFAGILYGTKVQLMVSPSYPKQDNGYDCGVFMLMGIRDVMGSKNWTFQQGDIRFKRIQLACEVNNEALLL